MFFGLISSMSQLNTVDRFNTGTSALAALDLSLVSGEDTTLIGANLSAGGQLNINTGGDFSVQAAIDSQRLDFFSHNVGPVVMTTITESSFVETAVFTKLLAGQGLNLDIGGNALLTLYNQAGVDAPNPEDLYPEELLALEGLQLLQQELANEYFYDKKTQLSPAFKALVSIAIGAFVAPYLVGSLATTISGAISSATGITSSSLLSGITGGLEAFTSTFLVESLDAAVSGDFDIGDILKDAAFSGVTAGLTEGIGLDTFGITKDSNPDLFKGLLGNFGNSNLSLAGVLDGAIDGAISSGLSSAVYGTDFLEGFSSSMVNTLVNLTLADVQFEIRELGVIRDANGNVIRTNEAWEGSLQHALLHGLAGCAAGAVQNGGQGCASGATAGVAQSFVAGVVKNQKPKESDYTTEEAYSSAYESWLSSSTKAASIVGATAGFLFSGGDGNNVSNAAGIAQSGIQNNYLYHAEAQEREEAREACRNGDDVGCRRAAELDELDQTRDRQLIAACTESINGASCVAAFEDLTRAAFSFHTDPPALFDTQQAYVEALGDEGMRGLQAEYAQMHQMFGLLKADPTLKSAADVVFREYFVKNTGPLMRGAVGVGEAGADAVRAMHALAHTVVTDPGQLLEAVDAIIEDPSLLPEAMWAPFDERFQAGDFAGAAGYALVAAVELVAGTKGAIAVARGGTTKVVDMLRLSKAADVDLPNVGGVASSRGGDILDGAGGSLNRPRQIEYDPPSSVVSQGNAPTCGPACCCMTIRDATGVDVDLNTVVGQFDEIRPTGVNVNEMSSVLSQNGVGNAVQLDLTPSSLKSSLAAGNTAIVGVRAGDGGHFIVVDGIQNMNGVPYYMTRDPFSGPRGVRADFLDGALNGNAVILGQ